MDVKLYKAALRGNHCVLRELLQEDSKLLDRALQGCTAKYNLLLTAPLGGNDCVLRELLQEDSKLLDRALQGCTAKNNPLHIAAQWGHIAFVEEILTHEPRFAKEVNSQGETPLHLASAKGHLQVVKALLAAYPDACYFHDRDGKTPLHIAAMKGRVKVLEELVGADKETVWLLTDQRDSVLHLCVKHNQFEALKMLVEKVDDDEFVKLKDDNDNTILHLLVAKDEFEVIDFLLTREDNNRSGGVDVNAKNVDGLTALDVLGGNLDGPNHWKIKAILKKFKIKKAKKNSSNWLGERVDMIKNEKYQNWLSKMKESLMVVAILMASMAFQVALNPPGGVWDDTKYHNETYYNKDSSRNEISPDKETLHVAGEAILPYIRPGYYKAITLSTTFGLFASLSLILLQVSGFSFQRKISIWILRITTWIAVMSIMVTYVLSYMCLMPPHKFKNYPDYAPVFGFSAWWLLICIMFSVYAYRLVWKKRHGYLSFSCLAHEYGTYFKRHTSSVEKSTVEVNP